MHRLFIALTPPEDVCDQLLDTMEGIEGARWQDADNLHLTLRFVGEVERPQAEDLATALTGLTFAPFPVRLRGVGHFETKGRPHAVWADVEPSPALVALHKRVEQACRRAGLDPETRKYVPHVTLARLNRGSGPIAPWLARQGALSAGPWTAEQFTLYESFLRPDGPIYEVVERFPLA